MLAAYVLDRTKLRLLWWKVTGSGEPYVWDRNEVIVREAFESMGPTFIKLGQVIASSPGLFAQRYTEEFAKCLDQVPPFDGETLKGIVSSELGRPIPELFQSLEERPLGSASIAQVHAAVLHDGRRVVVKVQRPGIGEVVDADLWWMHRGASVLEFLFKGARLINLTGLIEDFSGTIHEEIDFCKEAANLREFNDIMDAHGISDVSAPAPMEGMVTRRVLVMERFKGFKVDDIQGMKEGGLEPEKVLRLGIRTWLLTVLLHGFFHGDAHAGNVLISAKGSIGFLDFGIIGRFDHQQKHQVLRYVLAFGARDYGALADILIEIGAVREDVDREGL
ncbi:MAG: AarF/UbiB family protein, partial [Myxococcota bacterium]|nr:AarF/UbiB family protein [Myxococcota bacterium]